MNEIDLHRWLCWGTIGAAALVALLLAFVVAPYGRHARRGWGPAIPSRWAWIAMESPASLGFAGIYLLGAHRFEPVALALLALWQLHYLNRTFVYPLRTRSSARTPLLVVGLALAFNTLNAYLNARHISHLGAYGCAWLADPRLWIGVAVFMAGRQLNVHSDAILRRLRSERAGDYAIPRGGAYRWVSCPNYLGEIVEWSGWALATWSLAGASFALFTLANLAPRAGQHHRWYRDRFARYPPERKALVPYLF